jgi:hypothetical protein
VKELRGDRRWLLRSLCHGTHRSRDSIAR